MRKITICFLFTALMLMCVACDKNFIKNGTYVGVDNEEYYITVKDGTVTFDNPFFDEETKEFYRSYTYMLRIGDAQEANPGIILTDEEKEELKKDLPEFDPNEYIGKTYTLEWMNEETYVKGDVYDLMPWQGDEYFSVLSGEYNPETGILYVGGEYILKK